MRHNRGTSQRSCSLPGRGICGFYFRQPATRPRKRAPLPKYLPKKRHSLRLRGQAPPYFHHPPRSDIWSTLPPELLLLITSFLPRVADVYSFMQVSRTFHGVSLGELMKLAAREFPSIAADGCKHAIEHRNVPYLRDFLRIATSVDVKKCALRYAVAAAVKGPEREALEVLSVVLDSGVVAAPLPDVYCVPEVLRVLLAHPSAKSWVNAEGHDGWGSGRTLLYAVGEAELDCLEMLFKWEGIDMTVTGKMNGKMNGRVRGVLSFAAFARRGDRVTRIQMCVDAGAPLDAWCIDDCSNFEREGMMDVVKTLIDAGVPVKRDTVAKVVMDVMRPDQIAIPVLSMLWKAYGGRLEAEFVNANHRTIATSAVEGKSAFNRGRRLLAEFYKENAEEEVYNEVVEKLATWEDRDIVLT